MRDRDTTRLEQIAAIPLFKGLASKHIEDLGHIAAERAYGRGQFIFTEAEPCSGFYVCVTGRAKIFKIGSDGKEQILHVFGPHEPFGEVPVFEGGAYPASAAALEKSRVLFFPRAAFIDLLENEPSLALNMLAILSKRLRQFTALVEALSLKEVPNRLAAHLLDLSAQNGNAGEVRLDISKGQLASLLGTIPETLSRILGKMIRHGLIGSATGQSIRLLDLDGLRELARGKRRLP